MSESPPGIVIGFGVGSLASGIVNVADALEPLADDDVDVDVFDVEAAGEAPPEALVAVDCDEPDPVVLLVPLLADELVALLPQAAIRAATAGVPRPNAAARRMKLRRLMAFD